MTRDYLVTEQPDAILNIIDASNLERNLYLTTQLMELGLPVVIALNMMDVVRRQGGSIQSSALSQALGVPVIEISALKGENCVEAALEAVRAAKSRQAAKPVTFGKDIEHALEQIGMQVSGHCQPSHNLSLIHIYLVCRGYQGGCAVHLGIHPHNGCRFPAHRPVRWSVGHDVPRVLHHHLFAAARVAAHRPDTGSRPVLRPTRPRRQAQNAHAGYRA